MRLALTVTPWTHGPMDLALTMSPVPMRRCCASFTRARLSLCASPTLARTCSSRGKPAPMDCACVIWVIPIYGHMAMGYTLIWSCDARLPQEACTLSMQAIPTCCHVYHAPTYNTDVGHAPLALHITCTPTMPHYPVPPTMPHLFPCPVGAHIVCYA